MTKFVGACPLGHFFWTKPKLSIKAYFFLRKVFKEKSGFLANLVTKGYLWARKHPKKACFGPKWGVFTQNRLPTFDFVFGHLPTFLATNHPNLGTNAHNFISKVGKWAESGHD